LAWFRDDEESFKKTKEQKGRHPQAFLRNMGSGLHAETGYRMQEGFCWRIV